MNESGSAAALGDDGNSYADKDDTTPPERRHCFAKEILGKKGHQHVVEGLHGERYGEILPGEDRQPEKKEAGQHGRAADKLG